MVLDKKKQQILTYENQAKDTNMLLTEINSAITNVNNNIDVPNEVTTYKHNTKYISLPNEVKTYKHNTKYISLPNMELRYTGTETNVEVFLSIFGSMESDWKNVCNKYGYCGYWQFSKHSWEDSMKHIGKNIPYKGTDNTLVEQRLAMKARLNWLSTYVTNPTFDEMYIMHNQGGAGLKRINKLIAKQKLYEGGSKKARKINRSREMTTLYNMSKNMGKFGMQFIAGTYRELWRRYSIKLVKIYNTHDKRISSKDISQAWREACDETGIYKYRK